MTSTRVDSITYMLEKPGDYQLPPIDVRWWNGRDGKVEVAYADGVSLEVAVNPVASGATLARTRDARLGWDTR
jgi:hypothetical protein